ncbi:MAG: adenylate/guanylate cyclase domain-containing protein, partial [Polyangiales bacterium]
MGSELDLESLELTELVRLRNQISDVLKRRFERPLALMFTDIVGSTAYVGRFGNEAGRALQQRHHDLVIAAVTREGGRLVDTAGDGTFCCFPRADAAAAAATAVMRSIADQEETREEDHRLSIRAGLHVGAVLSDAVIVSGEPVNACARVMATADRSEIRITRAAFEALSNEWRVRCRAVGVIALKGIAEPMATLSLRWTDEIDTPSAVRILETGAEVALPNQETIRFGRLREQDGAAANDVVLALADDAATLKVSRWHFEVRRRASGLVVRAVSDGVTEVDGVALTRGAEVKIRVGTVVRVAKVMTLTFV